MEYSEMVSYISVYLAHTLIVFPFPLLFPGRDWAHGGGRFRGGWHIILISSSSPRFPLFGSVEFRRTCPWVFVNHKDFQSQEAAHNGGIPRTILTTTSRGIHTRGARNPSTANFAEGLLDWYLMGESDAIITTSQGYSYGTTAAIRTATPLYSCHKKQPQAPAPLKWVYK